MYDRNIIRIENDENQAMSKLLSCSEQNLSFAEFSKRLLHWAEQGREDQTFLLGRADVACGLQTVSYSVIAGEHIRKRTLQRTWLKPGMVVEAAVGWLNSLLGPEIVQHQAVWNGDEKRMLPKDGCWCATAIVNERNGYTLVLEAGQHYVYIVTIVDKTRSFRAKPGTRVFVVDQYGAFSEDSNRSNPFRSAKEGP